ncbi:unnamed protein product [Amoebophrya sp. A25]|nr:unnamed protein product [Amoebophrya sp. A25]|eukprot:GSA25T00001838001.1
MKAVASSLLASSVAAEVYFSDTMNNMDNWKASTWKTGSEMGSFEIKAGKFNADETEGLSLATTEDARFYGASASFTPFSNKDKTLIIQYQAKYDKDIECGGGYIKLGPKLEKPEEFGDPTPYNIMFGPDKCGYTKRTHLIFSYKGKNVLKKTDLPYKQETDGVSNLYRLTVKPDGTVDVSIDKESVYSGKLSEDWDLLPAKEIADVDDVKPSDWVDSEMMDDPDATKPDDWVDEEEIVDEDAKKPEDWDEEEDGEWEAPKKKNPAFKGPWTAPKIKNPEYKGVWVQKQIPNPDYDENAADTLYAFEEFGFVGFDLWQVKAGSFFDNLIITDDEAEADKFAAKWDTQAAAEKEQLKKATSTTTTTPADGDDDDVDDDKDDDDKDEDEI